MNQLNCKLYYRQLHLKYWCNLARYWLQAVWGWHDSVETCSGVIICEIIVCICWFRVQNNENLQNFVILSSTPAGVSTSVILPSLNEILWIFKCNFNVLDIFLITPCTLHALPLSYYLTLTTITLVGNKANYY